MICYTTVPCATITPLFTPPGTRARWRTCSTHSGWQERVWLLEACGFVEVVASGGDKLGLAFLPNPNVVLIDLWARKRQQSPGPYDPPGLAGLQDATMSAFLERAIDVGANDVTRAHAKMNAAKRKADAAASPKKPAIRLRKRPSTAPAKSGG